MKYAVLMFLLLSSPAALAQKPKATNTAVKKTAAPKSAPAPLSEKERWQRASAHELAVDRVAALEKFMTDFPESDDRPAAVELLASSRLLIADEKLLSGDPVGALAMYRRVVEEAPRPVPTELFKESIAGIPATLFRRGQREAAVELAKLIENKVDDNAAQLVEVAAFFLNLEQGSEAMRVAAKAAARDANSPVVHRTLALAHRINFDLDLSADSYAKALELEPESVASKRGLADMKRALGRSDEAAALYRELFAKNPADAPARTGMILALFDAGKRAEAETELVKALEEMPGNFALMAGAAYWYAAKGEANRSVELAQKAVAREPRYIWSHIALARGQMRQGKPVAAEQTLIKARAYGNFPTLEYELASARAAAGFYREAAEDLARYFSVTAGGVRTNLGGRIPREEKSLADLVAHERRASIFAPDAADTPENAETLRALLDLEQKLQAAEPNESDVAAAADAFARVGDKMKVHRQLYAASQLLQKRVAIPKALELAKAATGNTDTALDIGDAGAAVMASELYEARSAAFRKNDYLLVPEVSKQTLSAILRGRIEELTGWALYQQNSFADAAVRLRRAVSVMPKDSAWWRSSMWRLGATLAADGKDTEALNAYIDSYKIDKPDFGKYAIVESLYRKVHGSIDGLEEKLGRDRVATNALSAEPQPSPSAQPSPATTVAANEAAPADTATPAKTETASQEKPAPLETKVEPAVEPAKPETAPQEKPATETKVEPAKTETAPQEKPSPESPAKPEPTTEAPAKVETAPEEKPRPSEAKPAGETPETTPKEKPASEIPPTPEPTPATEKTGNEIPPKTEPVAEQPVKSEPTPEKIKVEPEPATPPAETPAEAKKETEPAPSETKKAESAVEKPKLLFEPIIITIPRPPKKSDTAEPKKEAAGETAPSEKQPAAETPRARVIEGQEATPEAPPPCTISVGQGSISLINNGGTVGLLVQLEGPGDIKDLRAVSSSAKDIEVVRQPEIAGFPDRLFFVIKSVSTAVGVYQVTFTAPCGTRDVVVTVR